MYVRNLHFYRAFVLFYFRVGPYPKKELGPANPAQLRGNELHTWRVVSLVFTSIRQVEEVRGDLNPLLVKS